MKITNLTESSGIYTCNAYLVLGAWSTLEDVNTLVDVGRDPAIIRTIDDVYTGVGKKRVDQVVVTHSHYDHTGMLREICAAYSPRVYAFSPFWESDSGLLSDVLSPAQVHIVKDGDTLRIGDRTFEVIHAPGHSNDSICFYCEAEGILFAGDSPLVLRAPASYDSTHREALRRLSQKKINTIYFGHGAPMTGNCSKVLQESVEFVHVG